MDKILILSEDESAAGFLGVVLQREYFLPILANGREMAVQNILTLDPDVLILDAPCAASTPSELCLQMQRFKINASSGKSVGDGERQRTVPVRNRRNLLQVESKDRC